MKRKVLIILLFTTLFSISKLIAQPVLINLQENPTLIKYNKTHKLTNYKTTIDTLSLPFFDDFAKTKIYPDSSIWLDMNVFINTTAGDNPPSIGVATFDALDSTGNLYPNAGPNDFIGDYLTSKPIDLNYLPSDSIYLSFFYQARGLTGNAPEIGDSLVLEFKTPNKNWTYIWAGVFDSTFNFKQVFIPIIDTTYLKKGFQFRFYNYASIGGNYLPSWSFNSDYWNLDFINLDKNRTNNETINDVCFIYNYNSFLKNFTSMPWTHFNYDNSQDIKKINFNYKNLGSDTINITKYFNRINITTNYSLPLASFGVDNVLPYAVTNDTLVYSNDKTFEQNQSIDSADWEIKAYLKTDTIALRQNLRWNDTISFIQHFYNYYAYDDGTPENGYGISGTGTEYAKIAYMYNTLMPDSLRAIQIYFNPTRNDYTETIPFYLTIWDNKNGKPNNIIYQKSTSTPVFKDSIYEFSNYILDSVIFLQDTFFIGWQKTVEDLINIGFDNNNDTKEKLYYNISGTWVQSTFKGSLMMRPVFGKELPASIKKDNILKNINIYPNPANNFIYIDYANYSSNDDVIIYDNLGSIAYKSKIKSQINISNLSQGLYFIRIISKNQQSETKKIMIIH